MIKDWIRTRRSVRKYKSDEVSRELLDELFERAARTQTMGNLQLYSIIVTRDTDVKQRLLAAHFGQSMVTDASVVVTVCADFHRVTRWCEERNAQPGYDNLLSFVNAASDALLYTQTFSLLAEEVGLGVCYLGTTVYNPGQIIGILGLPPLVMPIATLTLGWPAEQPPLTDRLPLPSYVHDEVYHDYSGEDIDRYYTQKEELPESKHFVKLNGKETLAQVFTDCRYTRADNEALSVTFLETLRSQGFWK